MKLYEIMLLGDRMIHYIHKSKYNDVTYCQDGNIYHTNDSLHKFLNKMCMKQFSSLEGMHLAMKSEFGFLTKIPLYLGPKTLLFPVKGLRGIESLYINYYAIQSIKPISKQECIITFTQLHEMKCSMRQIIERQILKCEKILSYTQNGFE